MRSRRVSRFGKSKRSKKLKVKRLRSRSLRNFKGGAGVRIIDLPEPSKATTGKMREMKAQAKSSTAKSSSISRNRRRGAVKKKSKPSESSSPKSSKSVRGILKRPSSNPTTTNTTKINGKVYGPNGLVDQELNELPGWK